MKLIFHIILGLLFEKNRIYNNWLLAASQAGDNRLSPACEAADNRLSAATSIIKLISTCCPQFQMGKST